MLEEDEDLVDIMDEAERLPEGREVAETLLVRSNVDSLKQDVSVKASWQVP